MRTILEDGKRLDPKTFRKWGWIAFGCVISASIVFVIDVAESLGLAVPVLYTVVIWVGRGADDRRLTVLLGFACSLYTVCGLLFSEPTGVPIRTVLINRVLYLLVIWMITGLVLKRQTQERKLREHRAQLEEAVEKKSRELQFAHLKALQSERLAAIGQMVTGLAHESKNALQRIQSSVNRAYRRVKDDETLCQIISDIEQASDDVGRLYEEVKSYAAPIVLDKAECNVSQIWRKVWDDLQPLRKTKEVALEEDVAEVPLVLGVDSFRLAQVFRNILENAISACQEPGRVVIRCTEEPVAGEMGVQIAISDNGPGLSDFAAENIFNPFFTTKSKGTGLGMAIAKRIVESHEGEIYANQSVESGAELVLRLPRGRAASGAERTR